MWGQLLLLCENKRWFLTFDSRNKRTWGRFLLSRSLVVPSHSCEREWAMSVEAMPVSAPGSWVRLSEVNWLRPPSLCHNHTGSRSRRWQPLSSPCVSGKSVQASWLVRPAPANHKTQSKPNRIRRTGMVPPPTSRCSKKGKSRSRINQACQQPANSMASWRPAAHSALSFMILHSELTPRRRTAGGWDSTLWL